MVQLIEHERLAPFARFHMDGHWDPDGRHMVAAIMHALSAPAIPVRPLPWWIMSLAAPFAADMKELVELRYLWERPVRLDNRHLVATLGHEPHTPLAEAVRNTLAFMKVPVAN